MDRAFSVTSRAITSAGARYAGHPFARYTAFGEHNEAAVGFPFVGDVPATEGIEITELPGGRAAMVRHIGPYDQIGLAWERAAASMKERGLTPSGPAWGALPHGPGGPGPADYRIFWLRSTDITRQPPARQAGSVTARAPAQPSPSGCRTIVEQTLLRAPGPDAP